MNKTINQLIYVISVSVLISIPFYYFYQPYIVIIYPLIVLILYLIGKIWYRNDNLWIVKSYCYFAVGIGTLYDESKATTMVAVVAFIESLDILFEKGLKVDEFKSKINSLFKTLCIAVFGYRLCDLKNTV